MNSSSQDFTLHSLEARFEMQFYQQDVIGDGSATGGEAYGYYGNSWGDVGAGDGYVGVMQTASDGSGAMLDDGTFTNGSTGVFPAYTDPHICLADPNFYGCPQPQRSLCHICRC